MPEVQYALDAKISEYEWFAIQEMRKLQQYGYGDISMKCVNGTFIDFRVSQTKSREILEQLQT
jgi:hypothetical protein